MSNQDLPNSTPEPLPEALQETLPSPVAPAIEPVVPTEPIINQPPIIETPSEDALVTPKNNSKSLIMVILGIFFILMVILIVIAIVYLSKPKTDISENNTELTKLCVYNGQNYLAGESFLSVDGCNTCTCSEGDVIACTEMACNSNESTLPVLKEYTYSTTVNTGTENLTYTFTFTSSDQNLTINEDPARGGGINSLIQGSGFEMSTFFVFTGIYESSFIDVTNVGSNPNYGEIYRYTGQDSVQGYTNEYSEADCFSIGETIKAPCGIPAHIKRDSVNGDTAVVLKCLSSDDVSKCDEVALSFSAVKSTLE